MALMDQTRADDLATRRLALAFDLHDAAETIMRQNLRRRHPEADAAEIERRLTDWLLARRSEGDGAGRVVRWSERERS